MYIDPDALEKFFSYHDKTNNFSDIKKFATESAERWQCVATMAMEVVAAL